MGPGCRAAAARLHRGFADRGSQTVIHESSPVATLCPPLETATEVAEGLNCLSRAVTSPLREFTTVVRPPFWQTASEPPSGDRAIAFARALRQSSDATRFCCGTLNTVTRPSSP